MIRRLGAPVSDAIGCAIESSGKGSCRRISVYAWHPLVNIPARHWSIEEFAQALGLTIPPAKPRKPARSRI